MHPTGRTRYRLATDEDQEQIRNFNQQEGDDPGWPTVVAERDGEILGYLATHRQGDQIMAGPLAIKEGRNRGVLALRICQAYENVLKAIGIVSYRFYIHAELDTWHRMAMRSGLFEYEGMVEDHLLFRRDLK